MTGSRIQRTLLSGGKAVTKNEQDLRVDWSGCVHEVQINSLRYYSNRDEIHTTVIIAFVHDDVQLACSSCSSVGVTTYAGSGDLCNAALVWYTGSKLGEAVDLKVNTSVSEAGSYNLTGNGLDSTSRFGKSSTCSRIGRL